MNRSVLTIERAQCDILLIIPYKCPINIELCHRKVNDSVVSIIISTYDCGPLLSANYDRDVDLNAGRR